MNIENNPLDFFCNKKIVRFLEGLWKFKYLHYCWAIVNLVRDPMVIEELFVSDNNCDLGKYKKSFLYLRLEIIFQGLL